VAKRPIVFKPELHAPQGLNNYPGTTFRCFTVGDTLPFEFIFNNEGAIPDVTGWVVEVSFSKELDSISGLKVSIPLISLAEATFAGEVTNTQTATLTPGINYANARYTDTIGNIYIIDMAILEVYENLDFTLS